MTHVGFAVFPSREDARRARQALRSHGSREDEQHLDVDRLRVHEGSVDPLLGSDLKQASGQREVDRRALWLWLGPVLGGGLLGWLLAHGAAAVGTSQVEPLSWAGYGALLGVLGAVALVLSGRQALRRSQAMHRIATALDRGDVVLTVRFADTAQEPVVRILRQHGGRYEQLA